MRISDWSSDVCSSDLAHAPNEGFVLDTASHPIVPSDTGSQPTARPATTGAIRTLGKNPATAPIMLHPGDSLPAGRRVDRQGGVEGTSVSVRVDHGGRRSLKQKTTSKNTIESYK